MKITNNHKGAIGLPDGTVLPPGVPTTVASWDNVKNNAVVKGWLDGKILSVGDASPASSPPPAPSLLGSDLLPSHVVLVDDITVPLGTIVQHAHAASGLSVEDWNQMETDAREALLATSVQQLAAETEAAKGEGTAGTTGNEKPDATPDKDALIARAKALGIPAKATWGLQKLQEAIAAAEAAKVEG